MQGWVWFMIVAIPGFLIHFNEKKVLLTSFKTVSIAIPIYCSNNCDGVQQGDDIRPLLFILSIIAVPTVQLRGIEYFLLDCRIISSADILQFTCNVETTIVIDGPCCDCKLTLIG